MSALATFVFAAALLFAPAGALDACKLDGSSDGCTCALLSGRLTVDCSGLALDSVPSMVPANASVLILTNNNIVSLGAQPFSALSSLMELRLTNNLLTTILAGSLVGLANLTALYLTGNPLVSLGPAALAPTSNLQTLFLDQCALTAIPALALPRLNELDLSANGITTLPDNALTGLPALLRLSLAGNAITLVGPNALQPVLMLQTLNLQSNFISTLPVPLLQNLIALQTLNVEFNSLTTLTITTSALPALTTAMFGHNQIADVGPFNVSALRYLTLNDNQLQTITPTALAAIPTLAQLYIGRNPWNCCGLEWLRTLSLVQDATAVMCARPALVRGMALQRTPGSIAVCSTDAPDSPAAPILSSITPFSVLLTWPVTQGNAFDVDWYIVEYATTSLSSWTRYQCATGTLPPRIDGSPDTLQPCMVLAQDYFGSRIGPLSATVLRLNPFTDYLFRLTAHTPLLGGSLSVAGANSSIVSTATYFPSKPPVCALTANKTTIDVTIAAPQPPNGIITDYTVRLFSSAGLEQVMVTNTTTVTLSSLIPAANYSVSIQASTSLGLGPISDLANTTTLEDAPLPPAQPILIAAQSQALLVNWSAVPRARANGIITGYIVDLSFPNGTVVSTVAGMNLRLNLTHLQPATQYSVAVRASTAAGMSAASPVLNATTLDAVPSQPDPPTVTPIYNATCLQLSWTLPPMPNGAITQFSVAYWLNSTNAVIANFSGSVFSAVFCGLLPAQVYNYSLRAYTSLGASTMSTRVSGLTADAPANVAFVTQYNATQRTATVFWAAPAVYAGTILYYELYQVRKLRALNYYAPIEDTGISLLYSGNQTNTTLTGLDPATAYSHIVLAYTSAGCRNDSIVTTMLTASAVSTRPGQPQVTVLDTTTAVLQWTAPLVPNGNITQYGIFTQSSSLPMVVVPGSSLKATINTLTDQTTYAFFIAAYTSAGIGEYSRTTQITTPNEDKNFNQTIVIVVVIAFVVVLSIGYAYERRRVAISRQAVPAELPNELAAEEVAVVRHHRPAQLGNAKSSTVSFSSLPAFPFQESSPSPPPNHTIIESVSPSPIPDPLLPGTLQSTADASHRHALPTPGASALSLRTRAQQLQLDSSSSEDEAPPQFV